MTASKIASGELVTPSERIHFTNATMSSFEYEWMGFPGCKSGR